MPEQNQAERPVHYLVKALGFAVPAVLIGLQAFMWIAALLSPTLYLYNTDFRAYYVAGHMVDSGRRTQVYQIEKFMPEAHRVLPADSEPRRYIHPAYELLIFALLAFAPLHAAYIFWAVVQTAIVFVTCRILKPYLGELRDLHLSPALIAFAFFPVSFAILQGQDSLLFLLLLSYTFVLLQRHQEFLGGIVLGCGVFRFQLLLPLVLLFSAWRSGRLLRGFAITAFLSIIASVLICGLGAQTDYAHMLRSVGAPSAVTALSMPNLRGIVAGLRGGSDSWRATFAVSMLVLVIVWAVGRSRTMADRLLVSLTASCLITYHLFGHDLSLLTLPLLALINGAFRCRRYYVLAIAGTILAAPLTLTAAEAPAWLNAVASMMLLIIMCGIRFELLENRAIARELRCPAI